MVQQTKYPATVVKHGNSYYVKVPVKDRQRMSIGRNDVLEVTIKKIYEADRDGDENADSRVAPYKSLTEPVLRGVEA